ncbi:hypothetical protein [Porphyromonas sp.]|uniref:hypothetical protein n=1 Tax=Porphyromonas sp. TaxID=1924944 RepID=UPI0026DAFC48|nr:hypothetical protein [Porphyromonas sp.]MDO4770601.1 hypothetical protein [Porphyromonas sp.]
MDTKTKTTTTCGCCGHEIPRRGFFSRAGYTLTCPNCKTQGWVRRMSKRSYLTLLLSIFLPQLSFFIVKSLFSGFTESIFWGLFISYIIVGLPLLALHVYLYEAEYMWPKDVIDNKDNKPHEETR